MKICWFNDRRLGIIQDDKVYDVSAVLQKLPKPVYPYPKGDPLIAHLDSIKEDLLDARRGATVHTIADVKFLSPVAAPTKIIGTPGNYRAHIEEAMEQIEEFGGTRDSKPTPIEDAGLFLKATSSLIGPSEGVQPRFPNRRTDHELELGLVIGRKASKISEGDALSCVAGYSIALDMVVRGKEFPSFRKSVDTYAVLGPWLVTADEIPDPANLNLSLSINGTMKQEANTRSMLLGIKRQIAWASEFYTLWPGDIIMTGTCAGVSRVHPGDIMHCEIEKIGAMDVSILPYV